MLDYELEFGLDGEFEADFEDEYESEEFLGGLLASVAPLAVRAVSSMFRESEFEVDDDGEFEYELEAELESVPNSPDEAMMYHLANLAANSESEAEAEAFFGAIASLASKALPLVRKVAPTLIRGAARLGGRLFRSPRTRRLVRTIPTIMRGTAHSLARQAAQGQPINSQTAARTLARNTARVFRSPRRTTMAMRRTRRYRPRRRSVYAYR